MTTTNLSTLRVLLHGRPIGTLTHLGGERTIFAFTDDYIHDPARPTLGLRFKDTMGELITDFRPYKIRLMPFFSNLLPEGHLRTYLAEKADIHPDREFFLLWMLGRDLPGALTVESTDAQAWPASEGLEGTEWGHSRESREKAFRFSLAGVQLKFSGVADAAGGLTIPASGVGGDWIVKLPARDYRGVPENEFSMMTLARQIGLSVPAIDLVDLASIQNLPNGLDHLGDKAFVIKRFDRAAQGAVHIEDFAQVFDLYAVEKYKRASFRSIASVIAAESDTKDIAEFIRRLTFNTLIGNGDMHLKNWSLIYPDGYSARLAPAYDLVSTIPYILNDQAALNFSRSRRFDAYTKDEISHLAVKAALPRKLVLDTARDTVAAFFEVWGKEKKNLPMHDTVAEAIDGHLARLPIARGI